MKPIWEALYAAKADVVLNGPVHNYERFDPQTPSGVADPAQGIREFVVGTGGYSLNSFKTIVANSVKDSRNASAYGVLKLTLHPNGYDWEFVPEAGKTFSDIGSDSCEPDGTTSPDTEPPTVVDTAPSADARGVDPALPYVTATFSEDMLVSSMNGKIFKLFKKGSTTKLAATVSYDDATDTATLDPNEPLQSGVTYKAVVTTGARDFPAGNRLDQNSRLDGLQPKKWFFTTSN